MMRQENTKVFVFVEGGNVTEVMSNDQSIEVVLVDFDNMAENEETRLEGEAAIRETENDPTIDTVVVL